MVNVNFVRFMYLATGICSLKVKLRRSLYDNFARSQNGNRDDRKIPSKCLAIFKKLYPTKKYSAFQVTNVFELRTNLK